MKKNIGKKSLVMVMTALSVVLPFISYPKEAHAAETRTNFYLFSGAIYKDRSTEEDNFISLVNSLEDTTNDFVYDLGNVDIQSKGWVTLTTAGSPTDYTSTSSWSLSGFWTMWQQAYKDLIEKDTGVYIKPDGTNRYHYHLHGKYSSNGRSFKVSEQSLNTNDLSPLNLAQASVIPDSIISGNESDKIIIADTLISFTLNRKISKTSTNFSTAWANPVQATAYDLSSKSEKPGTYILTPSVYYITYTVNDASAKKYDIVQYYYDQDSNQQIQSSKTVRTQLDNSKTYEVPCPASVGNYDLVSNAITRITINGANGISNCYYKLSSGSGGTGTGSGNGSGNNGSGGYGNGNVSSNPSTSDIPIYIVWAIGVGALGYSAYYFNKYYKKNKEK